MLMVLNCQVPGEVDEIDFNHLSGFNFQLEDGYLRCSSPPYRGKRLHQIVAERMGLPDCDRIDHKDNDRLNNKRNNLRTATNTESTQNVKLFSNNESGYKGITFHLKISKWCARIQVNGRSIYLGHFDSPEEAHLAYCKAADLYFGEYANYG